MARRARFLALAIAIALLASACDADWTQFGFGAGNTRATTDTSINLVNVDTLAEVWTGSTGAVASSSPAIAGGVAYIGSGNGKLYAFDATGATGCTGTPKRCTALWTGATGGAITSSPAVSGGIVFVGSADGKLYAFDAAGSAGCSGSPKICAPLWTATTGGPVRSSPTVVAGVAYVGSADGRLYAFSAIGTSRCSGSPLSCSPRWTGLTGGAVDASPAIADGVVYVGSADGRLYAFDAAGSSGCSGSPSVCTPAWTAATGGAITSSAAVADGKVFVGSADRKLYAFDAHGEAGCSDVPLTCSPLFTGSTNGVISSSPAISGTDVVIGSDDGNLYAFGTAATSARCSGVPKVCSPRWRGSVGSAVRSSPAVAGGVVFVGSSGGDVKAFDADGELGCTTATPAVCSSVWSATTDLGVRSSPVVSHGHLYVGSDDARLHVFEASGSTTPVPPTVSAPAAVPGTDEVTVRWTPAARVDLPIDGYTIQGYRDGVAQAPTLVGPEISSLTLTGLTGGSYAFTVAVRVGGLTGAPSPMSDVETPSDALAPSSYQVNPLHDGNRASASLAATPSVRWTKSYNDEVSYPVVGNGRVFVAVATDGGTGYGARLFAYDQATGATAWGPVQVGGTYFITGLAYEDHKVFTINFDGVMQAFDEATGQLVWSTDLPGQYAFTSPPTAYRGVVYTGGAGSGGTLYAVDGQTGRVLWTGSVANGDHSAPAVDATGVYVSYACSVAYRFDPVSGTRQWVHTTGCSGGGGRTPVLVGNRLYIRDGGSGSILDAATGNQVGTYSAAPAPAFAGGLRFTVGGGVTAVDTATGQTRWTRPGDGTAASAPLVVGDEVVVGGTSGALQAYDLQTGATTWTLAAGAGIQAPDEHNAGMLTGMAADGGRLFVAATNKLVAVG